jgi:hypothetical protein
MLQTEDYARVILTVEPGVTDEEVDARLAARLARQATLTRDDPPGAWFLVDEIISALQSVLSLTMCDLASHSTDI